MKSKTLEALKGSIEKWERIVDGTGVDNRADNCPLCQLFYERTEFVVQLPAQSAMFVQSGNAGGYEHGGCHDCPVRLRTRRDECVGTPYDGWRRALEKVATYNPYEPASVNIDGKRDPTLVRAAKAELRFLKSLLPTRTRK